VFATLGWAVLSSVRVLPNETAVPTATVVEIGNALMGRYVLALEIVAVLLTLAMIGAVIVAIHEKAGTK
jgi:NADH-quinone oxidoreductase subunit J